MAEPKIRFPKFTDDWKQYKIGEVGSFYYGRSCPKWSVTENATIPCVRYGELYTKFGSKIDKVYSYTNIQADKLRFSKGTEVLIPRVGEDPMDYNHCTWLSIPNVAIGEMISVYNTKQNPLFTAMMFNATLRNEFAVRVEGFSVTNLYFEELKNIIVYYPCLEEQHKIADFLSTVDEVISQSEAEVRNLEQQKKAAMQKIFSQEVRFRRDDGTEFPEWENCILSDYCKELKTTTEPKKRPNDSFLEYSMPAFDLDKKPSRVLGNDMNSSRKVINTCCVLINKLNVRKKRIWKVINPENNSVCSAEFIPVTSDAISLDFLEHLALSERFTSRLLDCSTGTSNSQKRVTPNIIMDMPVSIPCLEEQHKIADFLSAYDKTITYAKQELEKWKELKKGLLQQMFV